MEPELIKPENNKNPLKNVLLCSFILAFVYLVVFAKAISDRGLGQLLASNLTAIVGFFLIIVFVISYYGKLILAWWIAFLFFPIVWSTNTVLRGFLSHWKSLILVGAGWFVFICPYLVLRYQSYKGFIHGDIAELGLIKAENDKKTKSFSYLALGAVFMIAFTIYRLYEVSQLPEGFHGVFQTGLHNIMTLICMATFLFFYYKKSVVSWWIIPFFGPLGWISYYLQHPFEWKPFLFGFVVWILICFFLIRKYEDYKSFMKGKE